MNQEYRIAVIGESKDLCRELELRGFTPILVESQVKLRRLTSEGSIHAAVMPNSVILDNDTIAALHRLRAENIPAFALSEKDGDYNVAFERYARAFRRGTAASAAETIRCYLRRHDAAAKSLPIPEIFSLMSEQPRLALLLDDKNLEGRLQSASRENGWHSNSCSSELDMLNYVTKIGSSVNIYNYHPKKHRLIDELSKSYPFSPSFLIRGKQHDVLPDDIENTVLLSEGTSDKQIINEVVEEQQMRIDSINKYIQFGVPKVVCIIGPRGIGKSTIAAGLVNAFPVAVRVGTDTSRPRNPNDLHGDHHLYDADIAEQARKSESYLQYDFRGQEYGINIGLINEYLSMNRSVVVTITLPKVHKQLVDIYGLQSSTIAISADPTVIIHRQRIRANLKSEHHDADFPKAKQTEAKKEIYRWSAYLDQLDSNKYLEIPHSSFYRDVENSTAKFEFLRTLKAVAHNVFNDRYLESIPSPYRL